MDNFTVRDERNFHNLVAKPNRMHLLDKPNGYASAMVKSCLAHQMRFTVQKLEEELCAGGVCIASGFGTFARECFYEGAEVFLDLCRDAVNVAELRQWSQREYELLNAARGIAGA